MTAPTEPLKLPTEPLKFDEAIQLLGPDEVLLVGYSGWEGTQYSVVEESSCKFLTHQYGKWEDAITDRLDRKVVARDDAAELRAALAKMSDLVYTMLNAEDELSRVNGTGGSYPDDVMGYHAARRNAWRELQELAQEYDDPAALAASEGQP